MTVLTFPGRPLVEWPAIVPAGTVSAYAGRAIALADWLLTISADLPQVAMWTIDGAGLDPRVIGMLRNEYATDARPAIAAWAAAIEGVVVESELPFDAVKVATGVDLGGIVVEVWAPSYHHSTADRNGARR